MLKLRKKLAQYQEQFYLVFILSLGCLMSMGLESGDRLYQVVFCISFLFLALKMVITDFTWKEIVWIIIISLMLGINFMRNHEKTLILTAMGIFGAKNVSLERTFKYAFWSKLIVTAVTILLAAIGIIDNIAKSLPKNGVDEIIYCYGYGHPNVTFGNIFLIFTLAILAYKDRLRWYVYLVFSLIILLAYKVLLCRTGLVVWAFLLLMLLVYKLAAKIKLERVYLGLFSALPAVIAVITCAFIILSIYNPEFNTWINLLLTGRIRLMINALGEMGNVVLGQTPRRLYDNLAFYLFYNYGIIILLFSLISYSYAIWYCWKNQKSYEVIILGIIAVYGFMEYFPMSIAWNLSLLCLSRVLFKEQST